MSDLFRGGAEKDLSLLCSLIQQPDDEKPGVDLSGLEDIIVKKIPETLRKNAPPDYYDLYMDFRAEYERFRDYILFAPLIGKTIVALGGGFSSGKSTFLNYLNHDMNALPTDPSPTTAVPTYVIAGESEDDWRVRAINVFRAQIEFEDVRDITSISHRFGSGSGEEYDYGAGWEESNPDDGQDSAPVKIPLGHILRSVFLAAGSQDYRNIAFLDTPGYSSPDSDAYSERTDEKIARQQLNGADLILWFVDASKGMIRDSDLLFLKGLRPDIPKAIILTRADSPEIYSVDVVRDAVKTALEGKGISCEGIWAYDGASERDDFDFPLIESFLRSWDRPVGAPGFALNFKRLFLRCRDFYSEKIEEKELQLSKLNHALLIIQDEDVVAPLQKLLDEIRREIGQYRSVREKTVELQRLFFTELKRAGDQVGILLPEPEEIDLLKENAADPLELLREYCAKHNIKRDPDLRSMLTEVFSDIHPVLAELAGGAAYQKKLAGIIRSCCAVREEDVRINDLWLRNAAYASVIRNADTR